MYPKPTQQERATEEQHNDTKITHKDEVLFLTIRYETHTPAKLQGRQPTTHKIHTHYSERAARLNAKFLDDIRADPQCNQRGQKSAESTRKNVEGSKIQAASVVSGRRSTHLENYEFHRYIFRKTQPEKTKKKQAETVR